MENLSRFSKTTKKKHEETEFYHSIQDWVFTTVCRKVVEKYLEMPAHACYLSKLKSILS